MLASSNIRELTLKDYLDVIKKYVVLVASTVIVITAVSVYYVIASPKIYQVETKLVIERESPQIAGNVENVYERAGRDTDYFQTQVNILGTRAIASRVFEKTGLNKDAEFLEAADPVNLLVSMVKVKPVRNSTMVVVSITGKDPIKITEIANAWGREFIYFDMERKVGTARYGVGWLQEQISDTLKKLQEAERALNSFIKVYKIVSTPDIESQKQTFLEELKAQRALVEKEVAETGKRYGTKHPMMISLYSQLKTLDEQLSAETDKYLDLQETLVEYKVLKKNVDTYKVLYEELLMRAKELDVSKELSVSNIRIIDEAQAPKSPIKPKAKRDVLLSLILSVFLGVGAAFLLDSMDSSLKTADDVASYTKFPFLGYIPMAIEKLKSQRERDLIAYFKPRATAAEAFRNIKVSLLFSSPQDRPLKTIMVTSSLPGEGKSFFSTNLAITFAQSGELTLLIDADLRKGKLHDIFSQNNERGFSTFLTGLCSLDDVIVRTSVNNLWLLTCGPYAPNPAELLGSSQIIAVLEMLKKRFVRIIIDSVPLLGIADALILGEKTDGIIFVVKTAVTPLKVIDESVRALSKKLRVIGAVLNQKHIESDRPYYYQYYGTAKDK